MGYQAPETRVCGCAGLMRSKRRSITMNERVVPGPVQDSCGIREAVCIHTKKIYDSCRE